MSTLATLPARHCLLATAAVALAYIATLHQQPYPFHYVIKALPCVCLALACAAALTGRRRWLMTIALLFAAFADAAIEFSFVAGLASFLVMQLLYTVVFLSDASFQRGRAAILLLVLYIAAALWVLLPKAGELILPVAVYMGAIGLMGISAACYRGSRWVFAGALLFIISDTLIAVNRFWLPVPLERYLILGTYFSAQLLIAGGVIARASANPDGE